MKDQIRANKSFGEMYLEEKVRDAVGVCLTYKVIHESLKASLGGVGGTVICVSGI